ncbi:MAG TPA: ABC transporter substrate-binding protein [Spirochaetia bacterium]|nr:ABC transporter substrate-binding protein [Spirochaetia bacterium]HTZ52476.1 ABC transporter substrate-binding protein [Spirochaetia bacterium]
MSARFWRSVVLLAVTAAVLAACGGAGKGSSTILIGGALCVTGIQAPLDEPAVRGAQLAVEELNKKGGVLGKKLEFVNLDGKSDPVTVGNVAVELIKKGAKAIIAPSDFDFGGPASREAQKAGIVAISPAASSPLYGSKTLGDKQFTMSMWNTTMGAATAEFAYNQKGWKVGYVVTDTFIDYTKSLSRYFIQHFKKLGGTILAEDTYVQGAQDFSAQLARLKAAKKPDFIFISSYMPDLGTIIRTIREAGITAPVVGGDSYDDPGLFKALGEKYGSDIYFDTHSFLVPGVTPEMEGFLKTYKAKFNADPDAVWVATGWDVVMIMADAMKRAGSTDGAAMAKAMEGHEFTLLTGKLKWSDAASGHEPDIEAPLVSLEKAVPKFIGWVRPKDIPAP